MDNRCPRCGTELTAGSPEELCPRCLLLAGLESQGAQPLSPPTAAYSPGFTPPTPEELSRYFPQLEILELLGKGGMGAVYKARQPGLDRLVALKILPPDVGGAAAFSERFTREARALARLSHPNIVGVFDFGQAFPSPAGEEGRQGERGLYYFLMEYVDGVNLRQALRAGSLNPPEALKIVPQICDALQFAHDEGVVHRDIKPENILLDKRGRVKIADFGLAKLLGAKTDHNLTGTHQVMGTPHYMAPEQIQGTRDVDHRADIYSLGVTFYEMLTGELPLGRFALPSKKVHIDVRLDEVVLRALEVEPEKRYQHASEVKTQVEEIGGLSPAVLARAYGREYKSRATLFGVPLLHIAFGINPRTGRKRVAKGIIALGDVAIGAFACGGFAMGGVAFGGASIGLVSLGGFALGLLMAVGGLAIGFLAFGGLAVGGIAIGGAAFGYYASGGGGWGVHALLAERQDPEAVAFFESWINEWPRWLALLGLGLPVLAGLLYSFVWCVFRFSVFSEGAFETQQKGGAPASDSIADLRRAGAWLLASGIISLFAWAPYVYAWFAFAEPRGKIFFHNNIPTVLDGLIVYETTVGLIRGIFIILGASAARGLRDLGRVNRAGVLAILPISLSWFITFPVGIWLRRLLGRPEVLQAFERSRRWQAAIREKEANEPGWAFVFGWLFGRLIAWPRVVVVPLGLLGAVMLFQFWLAIVIEPTFQPPARVWAYEKVGYDLWQGRAVCAILFVLACIALATARLRQERWPALLLLLGALAATIISASVLAQPPLPDSPELRQAASAVRFKFADILVAGQTDVQFLEEARMRGLVTVRWQVKGAAHGALVLGALIILFASIDMQRSVRR